MKLAVLVPVAAVLFCGAGSARANWDDDFIRITCVPESGYLRVDHMLVDGKAVYHGAGRDRKKKAQIRQTWRQRGYYSPEKLKYDCVMRKATFSVHIDRDPYVPGERCEDYRKIKFSLLRNGIPVLSKVGVGEDCFFGIAVSSVQLQMDTQNRVDVGLCLTLQDGLAPVCGTLERDYAQIGTRDRRGRLNKEDPVDQGKIGDLAEKFEKRSQQPSALPCYTEPFFHMPSFQY
jgi:hypothetical protein